MPRISLILPTGPQDGPIGPRIEPWRLGLEQAGHEVEVLVVRAGGAESGPGWRGLTAEAPGRTAAAITGLRHGTGEILLVLDPASGHAPADLARVVAPLAEGRADLAIAATGVPGADGTPAPGRGPLRAILRAAVGTTAPGSGLVGLTREALDAVRDHFRPAGGSFAFELLARVTGRWVEVPVGPGIGRRPALRLPRVDDLRQWKRLADHRFGNASRLIQFCAVGGSGTIVDLCCYFAFQPLFARTTLAEVFVPPTRVTFDLFVARSLAILVALTWNFSLNRRLTFSYARSGSAGRQFIKYLLSNSLGVALSMLLSLGLPRKIPFFNEHKLAAALVGIVAATGISFTMSRWLVFNDRDDSPTPPGPRSRRMPHGRQVECATTPAGATDLA